jgi:hypothetical protein
MTAAGTEEAGQRPLGAAFERLAIDVFLPFEGVCPSLLHGDDIARCAAEGEGPSW